MSADKKLKIEVSIWTALALVIALGLFTAREAIAGAIHTWSSNETLTAADLNANFQHIHNNMVGNHGARLVDADVNASAAISTSKLAAYRYIPVLYVYTTAICTTGTCSTIGNGFTSVTFNSAGNYFVNMTARSNSSYVAVVSPVDASQRVCQVTAQTTTRITVQCSTTGGSATNTEFSLIMLDDD